MKNKVMMIAGMAVLTSLISVASFAHAQSAVPNMARRMCVDFQTNIGVGSRDANTFGNVYRLQQYLQSRGDLAVAPTGYFGALTKAAVQKFQMTYGVPATGFVGPLTRVQLQKVTCSGDDISLPPVQSDFSISATTDKAVYQVGEPVVVTITAKNTSSESKTMQFTNGCETTVKIVNEYDPTPARLCILSLGFKTFQPGESKTWTVTHTKDQFLLTAGTHMIEASIANYGSATIPVTVVSSKTSVTVTSPKRGETVKIGSTQKISWTLADATEFSRVDISVKPYIVCIKAPCEAAPLVSMKNVPFNTNDPFHTWNVSTSTPPGNYVAEVCVTGTTICGKSDNYFTVVQ